MKTEIGIEWWIISGLLILLLVILITKFVGSISPKVVVAADGTTTVHAAATTVATQAGTWWQRMLHMRVIMRVIGALLLTALAFRLLHVEFGWPASIWSSTSPPPPSSRAVPLPPIVASTSTSDWSLRWLWDSSEWITFGLFIIVLVLLAIYSKDLIKTIARLVLMATVLGIGLLGHELFFSTLQSGRAHVSSLFRPSVSPYVEVRFTSTTGNELRLTMLPHQIARARGIRGEIVQFCLNYTPEDVIALRGTGPVGTTIGTGYDARDWEPSAAVRALYTRQNRMIVLQVHNLQPGQRSPCP